MDDGNYERDLFPTWDTIEGTCNTREYVLKRDGTNVVTNSACASTSGTWKSPYDGATWTAASDIDIDHMVPLKNAWVVSIVSSVSSFPPQSGFAYIPFTNLTVWCQRLDHLQARAVRQRHHPSPAVGRYRQRQPAKVGSEPRFLEASSELLLLHLRLCLGAGQEPLGPDHHLGREERPHQHAEHVLNHIPIVLSVLVCARAQLVTTALQSVLGSAVCPRNRHKKQTPHLYIVSNMFFLLLQKLHDIVHRCRN